MSDEQIRQILIERKRKARKAEKRAEVLEAVGMIIAWAGLFWICFMLSVIGG